MTETIVLILKGLALLSVTVGALVVFLATRVVDRFKLVEKTQLSEEQQQLPTLDQEKVKRQSAILSVKLKGLLIALPGCILVLFLFR